MTVNGTTLVRGHVLEYDRWDVQIKIKFWLLVEEKLEVFSNFQNK